MDNQPDQQPPKGSGKLIPVFSRKLPQRQAGEDKRAWAKRAVQSLREGTQPPPRPAQSDGPSTRNGVTVPKGPPPRSTASHEEALAQIREGVRLSEEERSE